MARPSDAGIERIREAARRNKPWLKSTGPRTPEGKRISSQNAIRTTEHVTDPKTLCSDEWVVIGAARRLHGLLTNASDADSESLQEVASQCWDWCDEMVGRRKKNSG